MLSFPLAPVEMSLCTASSLLFVCDLLSLELALQAEKKYCPVEHEPLSKIKTRKKFLLNNQHLPEGAVSSQ